MKRNILSLVALAVLVFVLSAAACAKPAPAPSAPAPATAAPKPATPAQKIYEIQFLAASPGGTAYPAYAGVSSILNRHGPFKVTLVETAGAFANYPMADQMDPNTVIYANAGSDYAQAIRGMPPLPKKYTKIRWLFGLTEAYYCFASTRSEYKTLDDMVGKKVRIAMPPKPFGSSVVMLEVLNLKGITKTASVSHMGFTALAEAVKDDLSDVFTGQATLAGDKWDIPSWFADVMRSKGDKIHSISVPEDLMKKAFENTGLYFGTGTMPPGVFGKGQTQPASVLRCLTGGVGCQSDMAENLVYLITKTLCENWKELGDYYPDGKYSTPKALYDKILFSVSSQDEIHPGALRYYKEIGVAK